MLIESVDVSILISCSHRLSINTQHIFFDLMFSTETAKQNIHTVNQVQSMGKINKLQRGFNFAPKVGKENIKKIKQKIQIDRINTELEHK